MHLHLEMWWGNFHLRDNVQAPHGNCIYNNSLRKAGTSQFSWKSTAAILGALISHNFRPRSFPEKGILGGPWSCAAPQNMCWPTLWPNPSWLFLCLLGGLCLVKTHFQLCQENCVPGISLHLHPQSPKIQWCFLLSGAQGWNWTSVACRKHDSVACWDWDEREHWLADERGTGQERAPAFAKTSSQLTQHLSRKQLKLQMWFKKTKLPMTSVRRHQVCRRQCFQIMLNAEIHRKLIRFLATLWGRIRLCMQMNSRLDFCPHCQSMRGEIALGQISKRKEFLD